MTECNRSFRSKPYSRDGISTDRLSSSPDPQPPSTNPSSQFWECALSGEPSITRFFDIESSPSCDGTACRDVGLFSALPAGYLPYAWLSGDGPTLTSLRQNAVISYDFPLTVDQQGETFRTRMAGSPRWTRFELPQLNWPCVRTGEVY
jgi:hypothetical protein